MTNSQIEEVRISLFEFFNLEKTINETVLSIVEKQFKKYDFDLAIDTLLYLGGKESKIYSIADGLKTFAEAYAIIAQKKELEEKAKNDKLNLSYTATAENYTPETYTFKRPALTAIQKEARAFVMFSMLLQYKYLDKAEFGELSLFSRGNSIFDCIKIQLGNYLQDKEICDLAEISTKVKELANLAKATM